MCFVISAVAWKILLSLWRILAQLQTLDFSLGFYIFAVWTVLLLSLILLLMSHFKHTSFYSDFFSLKQYTFTLMTSSNGLPTPGCVFPEELFLFNFL